MDGNTFYILGGYDIKDNMLNEVLTMKVDDDNCEFTNLSALACGDSFYWCSSYVKTGHHLYIVSSNRNIHIYSSETNKWSILKKINWIASS